MKKKRLYKSQDNKLLFGVCGGIAEYFRIDPTVVRLIWAAVTVFFGAGILLYAVAVLLMPREPVD
ncbi:MAG: PspC domain-containing protein [Clostridiales bacterium]|nr:PspC domain-containing protein [Clostridiales bacterium]